MASCQSGSKGLPCDSMGWSPWACRMVRSLWSTRKPCFTEFRSSTCSLLAMARFRSSSTGSTGAQGLGAGGLQQVQPFLAVRLRKLSNSAKSRTYFVVQA